MPVLAVIPARLGSTRLAHKPLQMLGGSPLVVRVVERVLGFGLADQVVVATDAEAVAEAVRATGVPVAMTDPALASGTDRVAVVASQSANAGYDIVVNVQGDEPFLPREAFAGSVARVRGGDDIGTAAVPLDAAQAADPARVKVVTDARGRALYFSRAVIPHWRDPGAPPAGTYWQHLGIYALSRGALARWTGLEPTQLETAERLEQLRALEHGISIGVARLEQPAHPGIDTPDDLRRAEALWNARLEGAR
jgi:3-deoxy-manno-octulosonate cytidylyltransferase (CMP-KDO synthetase)